MTLTKWETYFKFKYRFYLSQEDLVKCTVYVGEKKNSGQHSQVCIIPNECGKTNKTMCKQECDDKCEFLIVDIYILYYTSCSRYSFHVHSKTGKKVRTHITQQSRTSNTSFVGNKKQFTNFICSNSSRDITSRPNLWSLRFFGWFVCLFACLLACLLAFLFSSLLSLFFLRRDVPTSHVLVTAPPLTSAATNGHKLRFGNFLLCAGSCRGCIYKCSFSSPLTLLDKTVQLTWSNFFQYGSYKADSS